MGARKYLYFLPYVFDYNLQGWKSGLIENKYNFHLFD
jgi:hypothetical protein